MKKLLFIIFLLPMLDPAQVYETGEKSMTGIFEFPDKSGEEIYSSVNKWVALNYNSTNDEIQMNNPELGTLIVKGIHKVQYKNPDKILYPDDVRYPELVTVKVNHTLEINSKENKLRIVYNLSGMTNENNVEMQDYFLDCINFNGTNENAINEWNKLIDQFLRQNLMRKSKRERYLSGTKDWFGEVNQAIINDIKSTMQSIDEAILNGQKADW